MSEERESTNIDQNVVGELLALLDSRCRTTEEVIAILSMLSYNALKKSGLSSVDSHMLNGEGISMTLTGGTESGMRNSGFH
ncbi:hypothetical protein [Escherichia coli]|uniref:hypothetical protein n=1 Tax=Escherichia coli TaxID=562 RepID=UPI0010E9BB86|nr:hypothetical protein [Escherichia coli]GDO95347.1 hypothetical protein BvCmsNSNP012_00661 [Escherichia coli]